MIILISVLDLISGSEIEDFIAALKAQNINPEISFEKNVTSIPLYNGAIKISLEGKVSERFFLISSYMSTGLSEMCLNGTQKYLHQQKEYLFDILNISNPVYGKPSLYFIIFTEWFSRVIFTENHQCKSFVLFSRKYYLYFFFL